MSNKKVSSAMLISEMDQNVKRMLKLIEEDGDSLAQKAEMYYEKRPEMINLLDEFQRMYRSLSDRYDHSIGETKKNNGLDIQSQGSCISEISELHSGGASPDVRSARRRSGHRAAGFDYFLGAGGNMELGYREGDEITTPDYESEYDYEDENVLRKKIYHLEAELRNAKEKLRLHQEDNSECSPMGSGNENIEAVRPTGYEEELRDVKEKLKLSEEEVYQLSTKLSAYEVMDLEDIETSELEDGDGSGTEEKVVSLEKKIRLVKASLGAELEILNKKVKEKNEELEELTQRERELATKIAEQQEIILEGAEEKREAIRQLCFSLEHYRTGYLRLRDVVINKKSPVTAT